MRILCDTREQRPFSFKRFPGAIVEGHLTGTENGYFLLKNVRIVGKDHEARVPWTWLNQAVVAHIHPAGATVTRREADA